MGGGWGREWEVRNDEENKEEKDKDENIWLFKKEKVEVKENEVVDMEEEKEERKGEQRT